MHRKLFLLMILLVILLVSVPLTFSQAVEKEKKSEISDELKKEATAFLRETAAEVGSLRTLENRISFSSEMANLMWFSDENEARAMFQTVIAEFRQLLTDYDSQMNASGAAAENSETYSFLAGSANRPERKLAQAMGVRQQIAKAIAEHDPQFAFEFFSDTGAAITNETFRKRLESSDVYFEARLLDQIAEKNPEAALKYGRKTLAKGFSYELLSLLKKIYAKDPEKGAAFGEEIVSKLKSDASKPDGFYYLTNVLEMGLSNLEMLKGKPDKRPLFSEQILRDLAELAAQQLLKREDAEGYEISSALADIEKLLPARAAQIRQKFEIKKKVKTATVGNAVAVNNAPPPAPPSPVGAPNAQEKQKQLVENIKNLENRKLPAEERRKVVEQSKKIIAESASRQQKVLAMTALAVQIAKLGDTELASELMTEARGFVDLQPKNYRDFMEIWLLAGGYAQVDAPKAFPLLEDSILRLNGTIGAFIKVGEFVDVSGEIINDGEVQVGGFGGEITNGLLRNLGAADLTILNLAVADFARTKNLTEKFDRTEVRILAKMLVLRGIFADVKKPKTAVLD